MITRFALFEGAVKPGHQDAFRAAVKDRLVPLWRQFPGASKVDVMFGDDRDEGAPEFPLMLAITYADQAAMDSALESPFRAESRDVTGEIVAEHFDGRIHHHVTELNSYSPA
ncbi:MAG: putative quinol monooxygenase [Sedimentitalea sp.]